VKEAKAHLKRPSSTVYSAAHGFERMAFQISYFKHVYVLNTRTSLWRRKVFRDVTNVQHWLFGASFIPTILIKIFHNIQTSRVFHTNMQD
jgi:hypothetical protein